jgi:predicted amidohydrolase
MKSSLKIALAQVEGSSDPSKNLDTARHFTAQVAAMNADLIVFPEMFMALPGQSQLLSESLSDIAEAIDGPFVTALGDIAKAHHICLMAGVWEKIPNEKRVYNTAIMLSAQGEMLTAYRKIHLFDALNVRESDKMLAGEAKPELVNIKGLNIGMTICYDLRFPELFRDLALRGADVVLVPSAWYAGPVKEHHWLTLLCARAVENTMYVAGANLTGSVFSGRSAAFDPFGILKADAGEAQGLAVFEADAARLEQVRSKLPTLKHCRFVRWT